METTKFNILNAESNIDWIGRKVTGAHNGTIAIKEGSFTFNDKQLTGGKFIIDTTSIKILDITDPVTNDQFAGHLASDDFFNSKHYPEAVFVITASEGKGNGSYHVTGDLTIKGITHQVTFYIQTDSAGDTITASGKIVIDRTKYEMKFRSGNFFKDLGDTLIYNEFDLYVKINAKAA
jgi:polyisoprenoid-binding protein YceI